MEIKKMSSKYRNSNKVTDVLAFKFSDKPLVGDIYVAKGRSKVQAKEQGHSWNKELSYLTIHGVLHLLGFTDYTPKERLKMFKKQDKIFKCL
ncbi:rRNA maturation RNase YbeY [Elusimicrobiota bacterium]